MQKLFSLKLPRESLLILLIVFMLPIEHMYDRFFRSFFLHHTMLPKETIKSLYLYASDVIILFFSLTLIFLKKIPLKEFFWQKSAKYFSSLVLLALLSLINAKTDVSIMHWSRAFYLFITLLFFCSILLIFRSVSPKPFLYLLFSTLLFLGLFESVVAISQYFLQGPIGLRLLGEPKMHAGGFHPACIGMPDHSRWLLDGILTAPHKSASIMRAYGTMAHPNVLGGFLFFCLMANLCLFQLSRRRALKGFLALAFFTLTFALFITYSRSALFAWLGATSFWILLLFLKGKKEGGLRKGYTQVRLLILMVFFSLALTVVLLYPQIKSRGGLVNYNALAKDSDQVRLQSQSISWEVIKKFPVTGLGFHNFEKGVKAHVKGPFAMVHNIYLLVATEMGLVALALFICFIGSSLRGFKENWQDPFYASLFCLFCGFLFIGGCDFYLLFFHQGKLMFFLIAALLTATAVREKSEESLPILI